MGKDVIIACDFADKKTALNFSTNSRAESRSSRSAWSCSTPRVRR